MEGSHRFGRGKHHSHLSRLNNPFFFDNVAELFFSSIDEILVTYFQVFQIAENLAVNIIVSSQIQVAPFAWIGAARQMPYPFFQVFPGHTVDDGRIDINFRNHNAGRWFCVLGCNFDCARSCGGQIWLNPLLQMGGDIGNGAPGRGR